MQFLTPEIINAEWRVLVVQRGGRTPEYLGKKIEAREVKLAVLTILIFPLDILGFGALAFLPSAPVPSRTPARTG